MKGGDSIYFIKDNRISKGKLIKLKNDKCVIQFFKKYIIEVDKQYVFSLNEVKPFNLD